MDNWQWERQCLVMGRKLRAESTDRSHLVCGRSVGPGIRKYAEPPPYTVRAKAWKSSRWPPALYTTAAVSVSVVWMLTFRWSMQP